MTRMLEIQEVNGYYYQIKERLKQEITSNWEPYLSKTEIDQKITVNQNNQQENELMNASSQHQVLN